MPEPKAPAERDEGKEQQCGASQQRGDENRPREEPVSATARYRMISHTPSSSMAKDGHKMGAAEFTGHNCV